MTDSTDKSINRILVFIIVAISLFMTTIDSTIVATALPTLQKELNTSINWAGWTLTAYSFGFVLMLPISGKLSALYGHRKIFLFSILVFSLTSLLCGLTENIYELIVLRVFQSIGGAGITPSATGIIVEHFGKERDRAVGLFGSIFPIGAMLGSIFGGFFVTYYSWRDIFFVNVPFGIIVVLLALKFIPKELNREKHLHMSIDYRGMLFLGIGLLGAMLGASLLGEKQNVLSSSIISLLFVVAVLGIMFFFRHIKRVSEPIIEPRFIYGYGFGAVNFINTLFSGISMGVIALVPLYAANRYGINALNAGLLLVAQGLASVAFSTLLAIILRKTGYRKPLYIGCVLIIIGIALLAFTPLFSISAFVWLSMGTFLIGAGMGIISPPNRNAGLQLAPEASSTIAALRSMALQLGGIIVIAIATAIISEAKDASHAQAIVYLIMSIVCVFALPMISRIPEHKGTW